MSHCCVVRQPVSLHLRRFYRLLHSPKAWEYRRGTGGRSLERVDTDDWISRTLVQIRERLLQAGGVALLAEPAPAPESGLVHITMDACRKAKNLQAHSGGGGCLFMPGGTVHTWELTFSKQWVIDLPVHLDEAVMPIISAMLYGEIMKRATGTKEYIDNQAALKAFVNRRPRDERLLVVVLLNDDQLGLTSPEMELKHTKEYINTKQNRDADFQRRSNCSTPRARRPRLLDRDAHHNRRIGNL